MAVTERDSARDMLRNPTLTAGSDLQYEDEGALLDCLRRGVDRCNEIFVTRFGSDVLSTAKRYLRSDAEAADCFQDTFMAAFDSLDDFAQRSSLRGWLRGIAIKKSLMRLRASQRRKEESIDHLLPEFDDAGSRIEALLGPRQREVVDMLDEAQLQVRVRERIDSLPDDYRTTLLLRDIDGHSTQETADILGIRTNAVKTRLHRARAALRTLLEPELDRIR